MDLLSQKVRAFYIWTHWLAQGFSNLVTGPAAAGAASPGNFLEMHNLRPHPDLLYQNLLEWGPALCVVTSFQLMLIHAIV